ncbi:MAG TPA: GDSL-type esterase/lipase family protein [Bacteroidales bacterium]|jgi:lysophospholipase L1-like esterase|nr:GDSL-type esterase/lipase family protein [Bacteroidales bacterium]HQH23031.1 GDSL-type esterase/lipase family protein [Bacteroidales bacterium]
MGKYKLLILTGLLSAFTAISAGQAGSMAFDLVFIGNSITQGDSENDSPPASAAEHLRSRKGVESVRFLNRGRSGYTTVNFLPVPDGELMRIISATEEFHKDPGRQLVFSIMLGTNDSAEEGPMGAPVSPGQYYFNMKAITDILLDRFPGCRVVYQQPIWYSPTTYNRARYLKAGLERLQSYFPELQALVKAYSRSHAGRVFMGDVKAFAYFRDNYLTDFIHESGNAGTFYLHPNKKGTDALGKFWSDAIYEALTGK